MRKLMLLLICLTPTAWAAADTAPKQDASAAPRGQLLYAQQCTSCHTSMAHLRDKRKATNRAELTTWVTRWATELHLDWQSDEIDAVADYLDSRFYKFSK
jgi:mono/diheme cytochrome c family protein